MQTVKYSADLEFLKECYREENGKEMPKIEQLFFGVIPPLLAMAYEAGKDGEPFEEAFPFVKISKVGAEQ